MCWNTLVFHRVHSLYCWVTECNVFPIKSPRRISYTLHITIYFEPATGPLQNFPNLRQSGTLNPSRGKQPKCSHTLESDSSRFMLISRSLWFLLIVETLLCWLLLWFFISPVCLPEPEPGGGNSSVCFLQHVSSWGRREGPGASLSRGESTELLLNSVFVCRLLTQQN